jgi:hypothetical protein
VCLGESCGHDGRAVSADSGADRHEESMRALALIVPTRQDVFLFPYPKVASPHHAVRSRAEADDIGRAEDEANDQADS